MQPLNPFDTVTVRLNSAILGMASSMAADMLRALSLPAPAIAEDSFDDPCFDTSVSAGRPRSVMFLFFVVLCFVLTPPPTRTAWKLTHPRMPVLLASMNAVLLHHCSWCSSANDLSWVGPGLCAVALALTGAPVSKADLAPANAASAASVARLDTTSAAGDRVLVWCEDICFTDCHV